ncbi:MAG TPA: c-type cytochrome [Steroidobacteraceae bacterium]|nr:c-type cytochrome [Steroidobacteraceae bacterium]
MAPSRTSSSIALVVLAVGSLQAAEPPAAPLGIGRAASVHDIASQDLTVLPDGTGLPPGKGSAKEGASLYAAQCAACHGDRGEGRGDFAALVGGRGSLAGDKPVLTVGSYWPYATSLFDYIRRAMPYQGSGELSANDVYALTAWILAENRIVKPGAVLTEKTLPAVQMPNKQGFEDASAKQALSSRREGEAHETTR